MRQLIVVLILFSVVARVLSARSASPPSTPPPREYWVDPSTGLMWAAKDNGKDVTWNRAMQYCHDLRLAGYSDWRLANMTESQGIYDRTANAPGLGVHEIEPTTWHVKGNLFLTAYQWSSNDILDDRGRPSGYAYYFDFNEGKPNETQKGYSTYKHALCARGSGK
jgi:hypothetical protein